MQNRDCVEIESEMMDHAIQLSVKDTDIPVAFVNDEQCHLLFIV